MNGGRRWRPDDIIAIILATALALVVVLILIATMFQINNNSFPEVELSANATQVLIAGVGGLTGLLGGYVGYHRRDRQDKKNGSDPPDE